MTTRNNTAALPGVIFWQNDPAKVAEFTQWERDYTAWNEKLHKLFFNADLLDPTFEQAEYARMRAWKAENPYPTRPFCPQCGHPPHPNEQRWCCNKACEGYLL